MAILAATPCGVAAAQAPLGTAFTYQGVLYDGSEVADGTYTLRFTLWTDPVGGTSLGVVTIPGVAVNDGLFNVALDFGTFSIDARWLEIEVSTGGPFQTLTPRQQVTPAPAATFASSASGAVSTFRIKPANAADGPSTLFFGNGNQCSIGVDPSVTGLLGRDPGGFRILGFNNQGFRLLFGPTDLCTIDVNLDGPSGLNLRDPSGVRLLNPLGGSARLLFGPTDDCVLEANPVGPAGLTARDPGGFRIVNPSEPDGGRLKFGLSELCTIGVSPFGPSGLVASDPSGLRVLDPTNPQSGRIRFGQTDDCTIGVTPNGPPGIVATDPSGLRLINPANPLTGRLRFGLTDECTITAGPGPEGPGMGFNDPFGFRFAGGFTGLNLNAGEIPSVQLQLPLVPGPEGTGLAFQWQSVSSRRYKENITPLGDVLAIIGRLQAVRYTWKENGKPDIGFIAEDVAEVLPEVVLLDSDGVNAAGLDYGRLAAIAIEGIKEQQSELASLREENRALRDELASLKEALQRIETRLSPSTLR